MSNSRIDPSLAEVRQWREEAQNELAHLDREAATAEVHRKAKAFMEAHGLKLKREARESAKA
jgi:hypothetical protein